MRNQTTVTLVACAALVAVIAVLGVVLINADSGRSGDTAPLADVVPPAAIPSGAGPGATPPPGPESSTEIEPAIVNWGTDGGVLSLVIRNAGVRTILRSRVLITGLDRSGRAVFATTGSARAKCCTIVALEPGGEFGLFVSGAADVSSVTSVMVRYLDPQFAETEPATSEGAGSVTVKRAELTRERDDAVVTATMTSDGASYVAGQAFLVDADDRLVAVISGRFYCFAAGQSRRVRMELTRPVPAGTRLQKAIAHPLPPGTPTALPTRCS